MAKPDKLVDDVIIYQPWGGLGDNLQFSTLPELFHAKGMRTLIASSNVVRNAEIDKLVWHENPFVSGKSHEPANAGACKIDGLSRFPLSLSFIERIESAHGLPPSNRHPKIYYNSRSLSQLFGAIVIDIGSIAFKHNPEETKQYIESVFENYHYDFKDAVQIEFTNQISNDHIDYRIVGMRRLPVENIFEYCDILNSCRALLTVHSGAHSLAVAIRGHRSRPTIHCWCPAGEFNARRHVFDNVEYCIPGSDGRAWRPGPLRHVKGMLNSLRRTSSRSSSAASHLVDGALVRVQWSSKSGRSQVE
jgi:hypothetical protein